MKKVYRVYLLTAGAVIFPLLAERILMFPLIERQLSAAGDAEAFGLWSWGYSLLLLVGLTITQGSSYCILKYFSGSSIEQKKEIFNFSLDRFYKFALPSLFICTAYVIYNQGILRILDILPLFLLSIFLSVYQSYSLGFTALFRVNGMFGSMFFVCVVPAVIVGISCIALKANDLNTSYFMWLLFAAALSSVLVGLILNLREKKKFFIKSNEEIKKETGDFKLSNEALYASLIYLGDHGVNYIPRIALGLLSDMYSVGVFVAAMSIASLILAPISLASNVIMSILSAKTKADFSVGKKNKYYLFVFFVGVVSAILTAVVFKYAVALLYPTMDEACKPLAMPLSIAAFAMTIITLVRPLVLKWVSIKKVLLFSLLILAFSVVASFLYCGEGLLSSVWVYTVTVFSLMIVWFLASMKVKGA